MTNTVKLNRVNPDIIKLQLFPFSLRGITTSWLESLPYGSLRNWEELVKSYRVDSLTFERRGEIIAFKHREDESLYNS